MHVAVCDFIVDCLQNSIEAGSGRIILEYTLNENMITVVINDNGKGMNAEQLEKVRDPFYTDGTKHKKRKVGLGIPFLIQAVNLVNGCFEIESEPGAGTRVKFVFDKNHIDTPPEGDIATAVIQAMMFDYDFELEFRRTIIKNGVSRDYLILRSELLNILGDLSSGSSISLARQYIRSQEEDLIKETDNGENDA